MFMSEISKTFAPQNKAGVRYHTKKQTIKMTDLIAYLFALKDLENKLSK